MTMSDQAAARLIMTGRRPHTDPDQVAAPPATVANFHGDDRPDYLVGRDWPLACDVQHHEMIWTGPTIRVRQAARGRLEIRGLGNMFTMRRGHAAALAIGLADWLDEYDQLPAEADYAQLREEMLAHA